MAQKVTVEEAKKKWCRHGRRFRITSTNERSAVAAINRSDNDFASTMCFGSGCMAWEWDKEGNKAHRLEGKERKGFCDAENNGGKVMVI